MFLITICLDLITIDIKTNVLTIYFENSDNIFRGIFYEKS